MNKPYSLTIFKKTYITLFIALFLYPTLGRGQGLCPPVGLPFYEDFNTTQLLPECWNKGENFDAEEMKAHVVGSPAFGIGSLMISCGADNTQVHQSIVMARKLTLSPSGIRMKIKMRANQAGAVIMVGVCKSGTTLNQLYGFVPVDTITIGSANTWNEYEIDFSNYSGDGDRPLRPDGARPAHGQPALHRAAGSRRLRAFG